MSAYICNPEHIAALAAFAGSGHQSGSVIYDWLESDPRQTVVNCALGLLAENVRSIMSRYPNDEDGGRPGPVLTDAEMKAAVTELAEKYYFHQPVLKPVDILTMCSCYTYQACETEDFNDTLAARQIAWIQSKAIRQLPGGEDAIRDFTDESANWYKDPEEQQPIERPILISDLFSTPAT